MQQYLQNKKGLVQNVFDQVYDQYDLMNDLMSLGIHRLWKKNLLNLMNPAPNQKLIDVACGTGDIAKLISQDYPDTDIYMTDINMDMLVEGRNRAVDESFSSNCHFCQLSGEILPFEDDTFDIITIGFGLRNFTNKDIGLTEMKRCLKKGGRSLLVHFSFVGLFIFCSFISRFLLCCRFNLLFIIIFYIIFLLFI